MNSKHCFDKRKHTSLSVTWRQSRAVLPRSPQLDLMPKALLSQMLEGRAPFLSSFSPHGLVRALHRICVAAHQTPSAISFLAWCLFFLPGLTCKATHHQGCR